MSIKNIADLCYELYKVDWLKRISSERKMDALKNYFQEISPGERECFTFDDYLSEAGYNGEFYSCYNEFIACEYMDKKYMLQLLDNDVLYREYLEDMNSRFY